jgi:hypothetical protein
MMAPVALDSLFEAQQVWKGRAQRQRPDGQPTGHCALDACLPAGGWPGCALSEILLAGEGVGELQVVWPALARLSQAGRRVVLVAPPHVPYAPAWAAAGVALDHLVVIQAGEADVLWAAEQCLRSGSCAAVLCWPRRADDRSLRRLHVAAQAGQALALAFRPLREAGNPSPAALRLVMEAAPARVRVLKCRGGMAPSTSIALRQA